MRRFFTLLGAIALLLAAPALADVTVRYRVKDQATKQVVLAVADNGQARFDSGDGAVLIVRDGVGYFVSSDRQGPIVGRLEDGIALLTEFAAGLMQMMQAMEAQAAAEGQPTAGPRPGLVQLRTMVLAPYEVTERGRETVAGRSGIVYAIAPAAGGQGPTLDLVIASDGDLAPVGRELRRLLGLAVAPASTLLGQTPDMLSELDGLLARGVPIRMGRHFTLASVSAEPIPAASFELPGPVLSREQLSARMALNGPVIAPDEAAEADTIEEPPPAEPDSDDE